MSAWWSPNLTGVAPGAATGVKSPFGEFVQRDPTRAIGYQDQSREGQFPGQGAPPTTGYTQAKYNTNIAYDPSRDAIGAGRDVLNWTNGLVEEYKRRGVNLDWNAVYADQWARKKRDLLAWGNAGDLAKAGVDMNAIDANAHDIGNAGWEERFKAGGYTGGQGQAAAAAPRQAADTRSKALDDPYRIGAFTGGYYDPATVTLLLDRATGKGDATPDERMQAAQTLKAVGLMDADNQPGDVAKWASERKLQAWADGQAPPGTSSTAAPATPSRSHGAPVPGTNPVTGQALSSASQAPPPAGTAQGGQAMSAPLPARAPGPDDTLAAQQEAARLAAMNTGFPTNPGSSGVAGVGGTTGSWNPTQAGIAYNDPETALQLYMRQQGLDPAAASRSRFGQFMMKQFQDTWKSFLAAQGVPGSAAPGKDPVAQTQALLSQFGNSFSGAAPQFSSMLSGATDNALRQMDFNGMDNAKAQALLARLLSGPQEFMNPYMANAQDNAYKDFLNQYNLADFDTTGTSKFGDFLKNSTFWQQILGR